jgi:hypothetical protein
MTSFRLRFTSVSGFPRMWRNVRLYFSRLKTEPQEPPARDKLLDAVPF